MRLRGFHALKMKSSIHALDRLPGSKVLTTNKHLIRWVEKMARLTKPAAIHWVDGSQEEYEALCSRMVANGTFIKLNDELWPGCYYARSDPTMWPAWRTARSYVRTPKTMAGPTNNWEDPFTMRRESKELFAGSMRGRTMYVLPFSMGPTGSPMSQIGVQLTDSPYVVVNMRIMTHIGLPVFKEIDKDVKRVVPCMHTVGAPLAAGQNDVPWPCNRTKYIVHFPETREIWSYGSGYGGNALLGKKCFGLRIASNLARDQGWMAEHMLILAVESPKGEKTYVAAAFPSACGKTNFAMLIPPKGFEGWKVWTVGDDIAWLKPDASGRLRAINPETGFFGVAPGTSDRTNRNAMATLSRNTIFTNVALTPEGGVWWEGMTDEPPAECLDWRGHTWTPHRPKKPPQRQRIPTRALPRLLRNAPPSMRPGKIRKACPSAPLFSAADAPPLYRSSIKPSTGAPAFTWARPWARRPPLQRPARSGKCDAIPWPCCRFAAITWAIISGTGSRCNARSRTPRIFHVNWFRKDDGTFLWPGFSENMRVLKWIVDRVHGRTAAKPRSAGCRTTRTSTGRASKSTRDVRRADGSVTAAHGAGGPGTRRAFHRSARPPAARNDLRTRVAHLPALRDCCQFSGVSFQFRALRARGAQRRSDFERTFAVSGVRTNFRAGQLIFGYSKESRTLFGTVA